jgi:hypothetical protein
VDLCVSDVSIPFSLDVRSFVVKFIPLGCGTLFSSHLDVWSTEDRPLEISLLSAEFSEVTLVVPSVTAFLM